ncbi:efflux transporter outer membrane subunit [Methylobacter sp.]|uniref:efflux transporter outer membrane subunit n=1 Tax=Methylobacter sp. TaxID=2051955 RepID=UPI0012054AB0|nr:efflux transporter outer membrane subunit [Methylobacter sp.]TAK62126.1 MAG: efflux transporter outer membrane subunit [Methylobacter sp.]
MFIPIILSILMVGCAIKRDHYDVPPVHLPAQYQQSALFPKAEGKALPVEEGNTPTKQPAEAELDEWWRSLGSAELNALVDQALANNTDLRVTMLRLAQLQARSDQAEAGQYPVVTAPLEVHYDAPPNGVNSAQISSNTQAKHREYYQAGLRGDWRVDLWGELSSMAESAEMQLWRATFENDDAHRTLVAKVVSQYIEYLSLNDRIRVAHETETALRSMLQAVSSRVEAGDATVIDLEQQRSADFAVLATIPGLELQREMAMHVLAQLLGEGPNMQALSDKGIDSLSFPGVLPDIPVSLLLRRPDIRAVEARLLAADADIDVARARLFPPLNLSYQASVGLLTYAQLFFAPYGVIYNAIGNLTTTIFDHGKRTQDVAFARSLHEELVETYLHTIYAAVRETEDAISNTYMNGKRLEAQKVATEAALHAWSASQESYEVGGIDFLTLLDTERTYHRTLDEYLHIRQERFNGLVSLYSALGGGVPQGGVLPGEGVRPQGGSVKVSAASSLATPGIDWTGREIDTDGEFWLVELAGLQDRSGVTHAWRDLHQRFPSLMVNRIALPRLQGKVAKAQQERATWYRVFIGRFSSQEEASTFCGQLNAKQVRCAVVASDADEFNEFMEDEVANKATPAEKSTPDPIPNPLDKSSGKAEKAESLVLPTPASGVDSKKDDAETVRSNADAKSELSLGYAVQNHTTPDQNSAKSSAAQPGHPVNHL